MQSLVFVSACIAKEWLEHKFALILVILGVMQNAVLVWMHFRVSPFNWSNKSLLRNFRMFRNFSEDCICYEEFYEQIYFEKMVKAYNIRKF